MTARWILICALAPLWGSFMVLGALAAFPVMGFRKGWRWICR